MGRVKYVRAIDALMQRRLSDTQETLLEHAGFLALDHLADFDEMVTLRRDVIGLIEPRGLLDPSLLSDFSGVETPPSGRFVPLLQNLQQHTPGVVRTRFYRNSLATARQLLGFDARLTRVHVVVKPPGGDSCTPWHQDEAYGDPAFDYRELSFCLALDDIDETSGCLRFVPGSHHQGVVAHRLSGEIPRGSALDCSGSVNTGSAMACPMQAGGGTIHTSTTIYGTGPNTSDTPRWLYVLAFGLPRVPLAQPRRYAWRRHATGWQRLMQRVPLLGKRETRRRAG